MHSYILHTKVYVPHTMCVKANNAFTKALHPYCNQKHHGPKMYIYIILAVFFFRNGAHRCASESRKKTLRQKSKIKFNCLKKIGAHFYNLLPDKIQHCANENILYKLLRRHLLDHDNVEMINGSMIHHYRQSCYNLIDFLTAKIKYCF